MGELRRVLEGECEGGGSVVGEEQERRRQGGGTEKKERERGDKREVEEVIRGEGGWSMYGESLEPGGLRKERKERMWRGYWYSGTLLWMASFVDL